MSKKLAIQGHPTRGKEVIELLEMLGGHNVCRLNGREQLPHWVADNNYICNKFSKNCRDILLTFTLEEFLKKYPFKIGDTVKVVGEFGSDLLGNIKDMNWDSDKNTILYWVDGYCFEGEYTAEELKLYKATNMEENKVKGYCTKAPENSNETKKIAWFKFWDNDFADKVELDLNDRELIQENGKWFIIKKKPTYPKTYKECCDVLLISPYYNLRYHTYEHCYGEFATSNELLSLQDKLNTLGKVIICRDAYWKIAGEHMGLDKTWDINYGCGEWGYWIGYDVNANKIYCQDSRILLNHLLVFPTEEMRDAFYENFKDLIERCKELL